MQSVWTEVTILWLSLTLSECHAFASINVHTKISFSWWEHITVLGALAAALHPQEGNSFNNKQGIEGRRRERREGGRERETRKWERRWRCYFEPYRLAISHTGSIFKLPRPILFYLHFKTIWGIKICIYLLCVYLETMLTHAHASTPWHTCDGQRTTYKGQFPPSSMGILGTELRLLLDLTADIFTCGAIHHS